MHSRWIEEPGALPRIAVLVLVIAVLGLPINNLYAYSLLAASTLLVFTGWIAIGRTRWIAATACALLVLAQHVLLPVPRIEEGHNVFLIDGSGSALEKGLPASAYRVMAAEFDAAYPPDRRCPAGQAGCWRPRGIPDQPFAFAADGVFDGHAYSRRVAGLDFQDPIWLRLGVINSLWLDFLDHDGDVSRLHRDRRSLAIIGRWQLKLPYFLMVSIPQAFAGSRLCWRGEALWERANEEFERIENKEWACRSLQADDVGRRIFGVSIGPNASLAMSLEANSNVKLRRALDAATTAIGVIGILLLLVRWQPRRTFVPLLLLSCALVVVVIIDVTFIGGYRPLDGGDDGLIYSGFARGILHALASGHISAAIEGGEQVFLFVPGMRYFRAIEFLIFGDTFYGYLAAMLVLPFIVRAVSVRFLGSDWGLAFTLAFVATPIGMLLGSSYINYITWASRGFADPLAATVFLAGLVLLAGRTMSLDQRVGPAFWGALLMAIAVLVRPNLSPGVGVLLGGIGLAALWNRQVGKLTAMCCGFAPVSLALWHNWTFGHSLVPFSQTMTTSLNYVMPPLAYWTALTEIARFDFAGEHVRRAIHQVIALLSGPSESVFMSPLHLIAIALVVRVASSSRYEPILRLTALAVIALVFVGLVYVVWPRYHYLMWLLMALSGAAWLKVEGIALAERHRPGWRQAVHVASMERGLAWLTKHG